MGRLFDEARSQLSFERLARVIGRYSIFDEIAAGGMAAVHLGRLLAEGNFSRTVAIKRLHPQFARDPEFVTMFLDEARLASRIRHPNVVTTLDVVSEGDEVLLVMEYVAGESLSRLIRAARPGTLPVPVTLSIMIAALHGLHAAHVAKTEQGNALELVHRDISPQNILVGADGIARVLDFGVAKASHRAQTTKEGQLKGKLAYMAPEQLRRDVLDRRSDIYAASVVLWECLTGVRLFEAESEARVVTKVLAEPVAPPSACVPGITSQLDAVVLRGLSRDPTARFATAREMAIALEQCGVHPAPVSQVSELVERLAADNLAARAARVADIERASDQGLSASLRLGSSPNLAVAVGTPTIAIEPDPLPSSVRYATSATLPGPTAKTPARRGVVGLVALLGVLGVAGLGVASYMRSAPRLAASAPPPPAAIESPSAALASALSSVAPPPEAAPVVSAAPTAAPPSSLVTPSKPKLPRVEPTPAAAPKADRCKPPYTIDGSGIRHLKPECL